VSRSYRIDCFQNTEKTWKILLNFHNSTKYRVHDGVANKFNNIFGKSPSDCISIKNRIRKQKKQQGQSTSLLLWEKKLFTYYTGRQILRPDNWRGLQPPPYIFIEAKGKLFQCATLIELWDKVTMPWTWNCKWQFILEAGRRKWLAGGEGWQKTNMQSFTCFFSRLPLFKWEHFYSN